jgi:hypothetical protein
LSFSHDSFSNTRLSYYHTIIYLEYTFANFLNFNSENFILCFIRVILHTLDIFGLTGALV